MTVIFDIETPPIPALVNDIDKIYCIAIKVDDEPTKCYTLVYQSNSDGNLKQAFDILSKADTIIGHNIIKFDIPVITNVLGELKAKVVDTLIDAKLMYSKDELTSIDNSIPNYPSSLIGSYSLKAFGYRFNLNKIEYEDFTKLCPAMIEYCKRDVDLTYAIYKHLSSDKNYPNELVRQTEYHFAKCIFDQQEYGFYFDYDKAMRYATSLKINKLSIEHKLKKIFKPILVPDGEVVEPARITKRKVWIETTPNPLRNICYKLPLPIAKNGKWKYPKKSTKWSITPLRLTYSTTNGAYQKLKLQTFNPGSRAQVVDRIIKDYGWKPTNYTEKGSVRLEFD
jgi:hypothetical protein